MKNGLENLQNKDSNAERLYLAKFLFLFVGDITQNDLCEYFDDETWDEKFINKLKLNEIEGNINNLKNSLAKKRYNFNITYNKI